MAQRCSICGCLMPDPANPTEAPDPLVCEICASLNTGAARDRQSRGPQQKAVQRHHRQVPLRDMLPIPPGPKVWAEALRHGLARTGALLLGRPKSLADRIGRAIAIGVSIGVGLLVLLGISLLMLLGDSPPKPGTQLRALALVLLFAAGVYFFIRSMLWSLTSIPSTKNRGWRLAKLALFLVLATWLYFIVAALR